MFLGFIYINVVVIRNNPETAFSRIEIKLPIIYRKSLLSAYDCVFFSSCFVLILYEIVFVMKIVD